MEYLGKLLNAFLDSLTQLNRTFYWLPNTWQALYLVLELQSLREQISKFTQSFIHSCMRAQINLVN